MTFQAGPREIEEYDPIGPEYGLADPTRPRSAYIVAFNAIDLSEWQ